MSSDRTSSGYDIIETLTRVGRREGTPLSSHNTRYAGQLLQLSHAKRTFICTVHISYRTTRKNASEEQIRGKDTATRAKQLKQGRQTHW
jgi:hypothetical protein